MDELTYEDIELIKELVCDGCKGAYCLHETGCYERCEGFQKEMVNYLGKGYIFKGGN